MELHNKYSLGLNFMFKFLRFVCVIVHINNLFLFSAKGIPLYEHTTVCLSLHLLMDICVVSNWGACGK